MVLIMIWKPRGLIATRHPSALLDERRPQPDFLGKRAFASKGKA